MSIYLIRHAESLANVNPKTYSKYHNWDMPLTEDGQLQAESAGKILLHEEKLLPSIAIHSSPYLRCTETSKIIFKQLNSTKQPTTNLLLSEISFGEQEGCQVEHFEERPVEKHYAEKMGVLHYRTLRGESFLDLYARVNVFIQQHKFFEHIPFLIIVSHAAVCIMLHYALTNTDFNFDILKTKASKYWPNCAIRKYISTHNSFKYDRVINRDIADYEDILD